MTKIAFENGKPVMRDGKIGTGQGCCCDQPGCSRCIRNGERDCAHKTEESCEECVRTYACEETRQTECDGDCPEGLAPGEPVRVVASQTPGCENWTGYGTTTAYGIATVGCGQILSVALDPEYHDGLGPPTGFARLGRVAPTITATVTQSGGSASGAVLAVELGESTDDCGLPYWFIFGISVVSPGSGYTIFEPSGNAEITIAAAPGDIDEGYGALAFVSEVDENGGIVSVYVWYGGRWYRNSTTAPPILTPVTVTIDNEGSGAVVTPVVDTNTSSPTFGRVTGFSVTNGGSGYISLCTGTRPVESCEECPSLPAPESANCSITSQEGPCGEWTRTQDCCCDLCAENEHLCECECLPTCIARPFASGTQLWTGGFNLSFLGVTYPPGSTVPWSTVNNDGWQDNWESWARYWDCSSVPFNWLRFFLPCGGSLILQVTIPCGPCGYAIPSPSASGFVFQNVPEGPEGNEVTVSDFGVELVCE